MRIMIAVHGFPPTHSAGAERQAERMAYWLAHNGHEVEVFAVEKMDETGFRVETEQRDNLTLHKLYYDIGAGEDAFRNSYDNPQIGKALKDVLSTKHFDLVHLISGYLLGSQIITTAKDMGVPVVVSPMEFWFLCTRLNLMHASGELCVGPESDQKCMRCLMEDKRRYRRPAELAPGLMNAFWGVAQHLPFTQDLTQHIARRRTHLQAALSGADLVIVNSQFLIQKFREFGFDTARFHYIRQGLTTSADHKSAISSNSETLRLGYIGQIKQHKGVDLLVDAVISLLKDGKKVSLDIWGNEAEAPDYTGALKARSAPYPSIRWNGRYVGAKVWDVIGSIDALVVPSRWYENSPNVILEAFEMRRPAIVTNLGGMAELVEHGKNGLVFESNSAPDLRRQIERLLDEPELLRHLQTGIPSVKRVDDEMREVTAQYELLVKRTLTTT
ncbi:MAG: glycosyltransferase [Anaerolineae bacterium]|nr:glycosyltransferase [Anaerolineae bacterium]